MTDPLAIALAPVIRALEKLDVDYYIGGSVASMIHGEYRQTNDVDIVADLQDHHLESFTRELEATFLIFVEDMRSALSERRSFNLIHLEEFFKIDIFPLKTRPYDRMALGRRQRDIVEVEPPIEADVATPEDTLLAKLEWYRMGNEVSDRQWRDILGICKTQSEDLDFEYAEYWAKQLGVSDLLARALDAAGLKNLE